MGGGTDRGGAQRRHTAPAVAPHPSLPPPPAPLGLAWTAPDLRTKSWDDLHKLWLVLLKERNLLLSARDDARAARERLANPFRLTKVRKSMARVKGVMWERARAEHTGKELAELRRFIDAL